MYSTFVKIKVLLSQGQTGKAVDLLKPLTACEGFSLDFLRVNFKSVLIVRYRHGSSCCPLKRTKDV